MAQIFDRSLPANVRRVTYPATGNPLPWSDRARRTLGVRRLTEMAGGTKPVEGRSPFLAGASADLTPSDD